MTQITSGALFFLAAGTLTSVSILSAYQILFTLPVIYYLYLAIKNNDFKLPKSAYFLIAFTLVALISLTINFEYIPKPSKNFGRVKYFVYGVGGIWVYKAWLQNVSEKTVRHILHLFLVSVIIVGLISIWQVVIQGERRATGLTHTLRYGYGSGMYLLLHLGLLLHHKKVERLFDFRMGVVSFVIGFIAFYLTYTRGAFLGFLCGLPFLLYFYKPRIGITLGGLAVLLVLVLGSFYLFGTGKYGSRFLVNKNNYADVIRRSQWQAAVISTKERPVLGWGLSNFHSQLKRIKHQYDLDAKEYDDAHSHNLFLEIASGTGLIGLFFFLGWVICWAIECFKERGLVRALGVPFGVCFVISSQFEVTFDANNASLIFSVYSLSAWLAYEKTKKIA
ncbi:MAG TPA: O-antigen ligase family protein [Bacteriovoracaceae bacterium]|nr:O-antigen ligase family protein [Bacteriovoracaceae bacterium]